MKKMVLKHPLQNYQIVQRNRKGFAKIPLYGPLPKGFDKKKNDIIVARVMREDDNLAVFNWTECQTDEESWSVTFDVPEGGLYRFEASYSPKGSYHEWAEKILCLYHIGVGDLYITTGQSNMTGYGRTSAYDPPVLGVHSFAANGTWGIATHPLNDALGSLFDFQEKGTGTGPSLSFARTLHNRLNIPVGIVPVAVGGSPLDSWVPKKGEKNIFTALDARMPYIGDFKGFLWYQGCSDANESLAPSYYDRFRDMIGKWREHYGMKPVLTVQLNRWVAGTDKEISPVDQYWGMIREAQRRAAVEMKDVYLVPAGDLPMSDGIHNDSAGNVILGERMANTALVFLYGKAGNVAPLITGATKKDDTHLIVHISKGSRIVVMDNKPFGMNVEDEEGLMQCISAVSSICDSVEVTTERPMKGNAFFHYDWKAHTTSFPMRDANGMPVCACYKIGITE